MRNMDYYVVNTLQNVFQSDALDTTRPMTHYVESPQAVSGLFDNIAYAKCELIVHYQTLQIILFLSGCYICMKLLASVLTSYHDSLFKFTLSEMERESAFKYFTDHPCVH